MRNFLIGIITALVIGSFIGIPLSQNKFLANRTTAVNRDLELRLNMRKLWEDHIIWTRSFIISDVHNLPDKGEIVKRLLKNQEDIGNAVKAYYGQAAGNKLTQLLKAHITTAVELVNAAKTSDQAALTKANQKWYNNANEIADFLSSANPNWSKDETRKMMKEHLDLTKQEAVDIITDKAEASIADYDKVHDQILKMADILSNGIVKQFSNKF